MTNEECHNVAITLRQHHWFKYFDWEEFDRSKMMAPIRGHVHPELIKGKPRKPKLERFGTPLQVEQRAKLDFSKEDLSGTSI
eukprot:UN03101